MMLLLGFLLGFISWRVLELVQLSGSRLRHRRAVRELEQLTQTAEMRRRLRVHYRKWDGDTKTVDQSLLLDVKVCDLARVLVANSEPFDTPLPDCEMPYELQVGDGESVEVTLMAAHPLGIDAPVVRVCGRGSA